MPTRGDEDALVGRQPVLEMLRAGRAAERIMIARGVEMRGVVGEIRRRADAAGIPVRVVPRAELDRLAGGANHQGVAATTGAFRYTPLDRLLRGAARTILFLDGVTDPHNVGSLIRSAECAGFGGVVLPTHRAAGVTAAARRVSAGAAEIVPVARVPNLGQALHEARRGGYWIVGLNEDAETDVWATDLMEPPLALVLGGEGRGLSRLVRETCDELIKIPQGGRIGSLNVAVAGAIAMFEFVRRRRSATL